MAGYDTTRPGKGARHNAQTVAALIALILCLAFSGAAQAAYGVITKQGTRETSCYRIDGYRLVFCNGEDLDLQDIIAIDTTNLTPQERIERQATLREFRQRIDALAQEDARIAALESRNQEVLEYIVGLRSSTDHGSRMADALDDCSHTLDQLETAARQQKHAWETLTIPELGLLPLRDIKILQYMTRILSYREWRLYLKQDDITLREYAREHHRQVGAFEERFQARLNGLQTKAVFTGEEGADVPENGFWKESEAPEPITIPKLSH